HAPFDAVKGLLGAPGDRMMRGAVGTWLWWRRGAGPSMGCRTLDLSDGASVSCQAVRSDKISIPLMFEGPAFTNWQLARQPSQHRLEHWGHRDVAHGLRCERRYQAPLTAGF